MTVVSNYCIIIYRLSEVERVTRIQSGSNNIQRG
jgi:hypothetical protein